MAADSARRVGIPFVTLALVALNLAAWLATAYRFGLSPLDAQDSALLLRAGAADWETLRAGEWWRLVTSQFLHVRLPHMLFNAAALYLLGATIEREHGARRLAALYLCGGTTGQLAGVLAAPALVSSGASQAVMALAGGSVARLPKLSARRRATLIILSAVVAIQAALDLLTAGHFKPGHLWGFFAGMILGRVMLRPRARE